MDIGVISRSPPARPLFTADAQRLLVRHRNRLDRDGFVHVPAIDVQAICGDLDLAMLLAAAADAPPDPYDDYGLRRRLFRTGTYQPAAAMLRFDELRYAKDGTPFASYIQTAATNSEHGGKERRFAPVPCALEANPALTALVHAVFEMIPGDLIDRRRKQDVGIHVTKLSSDGRRRAAPSPPHLHTDGEPWTAIILLERSNVASGSAVNYVAQRGCRGKQPQDCSDDDIFAKIVLLEPLEMIIVDDSRVSHHVSGVHGANGQPGWRTSLLIDFSPLTPERTP